MKRVILSALIVAILVALIGSVGLGDTVIYYPRYKYWSTGSVDLGCSAWEIVANESNDSSIALNFTYNVTRTNSWEWHVSISLSVLGIEGGMSGTNSVSETYSAVIPPLEEWNLYKRYHKIDYLYDYQEGEIIQYDNESPFWNPTAPPVGFDKTVTYSEYKSSLSSLY